MAVPMIILSVVVVIMTVVAIWSYVQYSDQKNNVDSLVEEAVVDARDDLEEELQVEFDQKEKSPLKSYTGAETLGSVSIKYPKTWSAYIIEKENSNTAIDGYFHPDYVPSLKSGVAFALRLKLVDETFEKRADSYDKRVKNGDLTSRPIKISGEEGIRLDGKVTSTKEGAIVLLPLRDKTIIVYTLSTQYLDDFTNVVLENLTFIP